MGGRQHFHLHSSHHLGTLPAFGTGPSVSDQLHMPNCSYMLCKSHEGSSAEAEVKKSHNTYPSIPIKAKDEPMKRCIPAGLPHAHTLKRLVFQYYTWEQVSIVHPDGTSEEHDGEECIFGE